MASIHITQTSADGATTTFVVPAPPVTVSQGPTLMTYIYSSQSPNVIFAGDADLVYSQEVAKRENPMSFPATGGTGAAILEFAPNPTGAASPTHRTMTLDYLFVLEGEGEYAVNGGEARVVRVGDAIVQRSGWHSWKNLSATQSLKIAAVSIGAKEAIAENMMEFAGH